MDVLKNDSFAVSSDSRFQERKYFHTSVEWKITRVKDRTKKSGSILSPSFQCSNISWRLTLRFFCANFHDPYLVLSSVDENVSCNYTLYYSFIVLDGKGSEIHSFDSERCSSSEALESAYIVNKKFGKKYVLEQRALKICFHMCIEENTIPVIRLKTATKLFKDKCPPEKKHAATNTSSSDSKLFLHDYALTEAYDEVSALSNYFEALHENPKYADVILKVGELEFPAHKLVLRSRSKVFEAMFEHDMQENLKNTVDLVKMDEDTANDMLRYIYCGRVRHLWPEDALHLYVAADRYDLQGLVYKCREIMLSGLSVDNVCEISVVADLHNDQLLKNAVISLISKDMKEVLKTDKWKDFSKENPNLSLNLIQSVILNEKVNITSVL